MNLAEVIARHASVRPDTVAMADGDQRITYRELDYRIRLGGASHRLLGIDAVAICLKDTTDHVIAFLSAARRGAVAAPSTGARPDEGTRVTQAFGAKLARLEPGATGIAGVPSRAVDESYAHRPLPQAPQCIQGAREIIMVAELLQTTFGKVDRKRLRSVLIS